MVKRGRPPGLGQWTIPGGRVEPGESDPEAVAREVLEETGLTVTVGARVGGVTLSALNDPDGPVLRPGRPAVVTYDVHDYAAEVVSGTLSAASDAADARWVPFAALDSLETTEGLLNALRSWRVIPR